MGKRLITLRIGAGYGLIAGLIGIADWVMAQRKLATDIAALQAALQQYPGHFADGTNIVRGYEWFYFLSAPVAAFLALFVCLLAAATTSWASYSRRDGVIAAWVAVIIGGGIWALATLVATATSPARSMTETLFPCESVVAVLAISALIPLAPLAAWMGWRQR